MTANEAVLPSSASGTARPDPPACRTALAARERKRSRMRNAGQAWQPATVVSKRYACLIGPRKPAKAILHHIAAMPITLLQGLTGTHEKTIPGFQARPSGLTTIMHIHSRCCHHIPRHSCLINHFPFLDALSQNAIAMSTHAHRTIVMTRMAVSQQPEELALFSLSQAQFRPLLTLHDSERTIFTPIMMTMTDLIPNEIASRPKP
jgi:hypothetical protein